MNNNFLIPANISLLKKDNQLLVSHYEKELWGVIRYMFNEYIVPLEIQDDVVVLRRNLHTLQSNTIWHNKKWEELHIQHIHHKDNQYSIEYNKWWKTYHLGFNLINDPTRWDKTVTEIIYQWKTYRSVQYNGDVNNHMHHQQTIFDQKYLLPSVEQGLISEINRDLISLFHGVHDLPEIDTWDDQYGTKSEKNSTQESEVIVKLIKDSGIQQITESKQQLYSLLFHYLENPKNFFKWWEKLNYIQDAINVFKKWHIFLHNPEGLIYQVLENQLPSFLDKTPSYILTDFTNHNNDKKISLYELDASKKFFLDSQNDLTMIIEENNGKNKDQLKQYLDDIHTTYKL